MWIIVDEKRACIDGRLEKMMRWLLEKEIEIQRMERGTVTFNISETTMVNELKIVEKR